jgi:2-oxoglutarate dehydrogenase E2 component (dihydrolipoamide succinyltransferase)
MAVQVIMPQFGESVDEATITKWLKSKGERVEEYEALLEVNTDKVDTEVPSPAAGVLLDILVSEGTIAHAGELLAWIGEAGEQITEAGLRAADLAPAGAEMPAKGSTPVIEESSPQPALEFSSGRDRNLGFISPVVARMSKELNIDLRQVKGSGQAGRITKRDLLAYLENRRVTPGTLAVVDQAAPRTPAVSPTQPGDILPLNPVRRAIAEHMTMSKRTSPHVSTIMEVDLSRVVAHRQANKESFSRDGANLTFTAYFIAASVAALKAYPLVNSSWSDQGIVLHREINIGMATSLGEEGLIVPVIKNADALSLLGLARAINDLAGRARAKQLKPEEVKGGTFTITNHGISGSLFATPIINQPQCAILGVGAIQKRVVVISGIDGGDSIAIRPMAYLGLTFDHRILDGALGDYFLAAVVKSLETW